MNKAFTFYSLLLIFCCGQQKAQNWTWLRGSTSSSVAGNYGTKGTAAPANDPGGRHGCATWTDNAGNLWLFGGEGYSNNTSLCWLNDLWKYDKTSNQWTWIRGSSGPNAPGVYGTIGISSPQSEPGAREFSMSWTDLSGRFWLFGGDGFDASANFGQLGDLWCYEPQINQWTWVNGYNTVDQNGVYGTAGVANPSNKPGCRKGAGYWRDNADNLWLIGGEGYPNTGGGGYLNDLWKYEPASNMWTWMKGSDQTLQPGSYGTLSVTSSSSSPGGRSFPACWYAKTGDVYMLGGVGHGTMSLAAHLSDLWKYEPATNNWTWIGGHYGGNFDGDYGTKGIASPAVLPGSRQSAATFVDVLGKLWLFGGFGYGGDAGSHGNLNDMMRYDPATGFWTWMKGDSTLNEPGKYGTMGVAAPQNNPGGRHYNSWWKNTGNDFWLFGGLGKDISTALPDNMNDLWAFDVPCNPDSASNLSGALCSGNSASLNLVSPDGSPVSWYTTAISTATAGTGSSFVTAPLVATGGINTYTFYASASTCSNSSRSPVLITVYPLPQISLLTPTAVCEGNVFTLTASGAQNYTWSTGSTNAVETITAAVPGHSPVVTGKNANGCESSSGATVIVHSLPALAAGPSRSILCLDEPLSFTATGATTYTWSTGHAVSDFTIAHATQTHYTVTGTGSAGCSVSLSFSVDIGACAGLINHMKSGNFTIYPNPGNGEFQLNTNNMYGEGRFEIFNALGKLVFLEQFAGTDVTFTTGLAAGTYFCRITTNGQSVVEYAKLIVR